MTELEKVIANLGYPVGMGMAPGPADLARMKDAIIEECALVAESFKGIVVITPGDIADAIRALKLLNFVVRLPPPSGR